MTKKKVNGYEFRQQVNEGTQANDQVSTLLHRILTENPGTQTLMVWIARIAVENGKQAKAFREIERIAEG